MDSDRKIGPTRSLLDEIFESACKALKTAELLEGHCAPHALHFAIVCWEECSKYLLAYCKDHLPEKQFKARYNHTSKYSLAGGIYFLSGGFSVIHLLQELHDSGAWQEGNEALSVLVEHLLKDFGFGDPERLANSLMGYLSTDRTDEQNAELEKHYADLEKLRTQSIYVDFDHALAIESVPSSIPGKTIERWLENARSGVAMLKFLRADRADLRSLIASLPSIFREETDVHSREMIAKLKQLKAD